MNYSLEWGNKTIYFYVFNETNGSDVPMDFSATDGEASFGEYNQYTLRHGITATVILR